MSTYTSEPGVRLGGRYRLEDRLAAAGGWSAWKAIDEILARPVSVITFAAGFPRLEQAVTAARAASRLTDTRLTQVFDVEDSWDHAYIVLEWPVGDTLADLVSAGAVEPNAGALIVAEAAAALAGAHAAGLAHLCLRPDAVRWTTGGGVKVTGLGIDAALSGISVDDPELTDTRGLGQLLYAALTGLWPGADYPELPPAPQADGVPRRPRQVRAGVPAALDDVAGRALALPGRDGHEPFTAPSEIATALMAVIPPVPVPPAASARSAPRRGPEQRRGPDRAAPPRTASRRGQTATALDYPPLPASGRRGPGRLIAISVIVLVAVAGASAGALHLLDKPPAPTTHGKHAGASTSPSSGQATVITPVSASGFDPLSLSDNGDENTYLAKNVLDHNPAGWQTQEYYGSPYFGHLKAGTGLILNLGRPSQVSSVTVTFGSVLGADVQIRTGNSGARSSANLNSMTTIASADNLSGAYTFTSRMQATGQYLLIWFTKLPPIAGHSGKFMAQVFSVLVHGKAA